MGNLGGFTRKATRNFLRRNGGKCGKTPLIRFVDELDFKQIPVSVKRKKKEECPSGLILIDSNCELKKAESSSESSSGEEDELEGENNSDQQSFSSTFILNRRVL